MKQLRAIAQNFFCFCYLIYFTDAKANAQVPNATQTTVESNSSINQTDPVTSATLPTPKKSNEVYAALSPSLYQVTVATSENAPKSSYGTGFIIQNNPQLLATNFHVIAEILLQKDLKIFLTQESSTQKVLAEVVAVDVVSDLALLRPSKPLTGEALSFGTDPLSHGEHIYSLGKPQDLTMSITEGIYNGSKGLRGLEQMVLSMPINSGMSGGPTVDTQGNLIGINVATYRGSNSLSFAVPRSRLALLLSGYQVESASSSEQSTASMVKAGPRSLDEKELLAPRWAEKISRQLEAHQEEVTKNLLSNHSELRKTQSENWRMNFNKEFLDCWSENKDSSKPRTKNYAEVCLLFGGAALSQEQNTGALSVLFTESNRDSSEKLECGRLAGVEQPRASAKSG